MSELSKDDKAAIAMAIVLIIVIILMFVAVISHGTGVIVPDYQKICESKGGIYLDRTYQSGKYTGHYYTCVKKDSIIELDGDEK